MSTRLPRDAYRTLYGPAEGDLVPLGDTGLNVLVERSVITPGEELLVGAGRNFRDGLASTARADRDSALDLVIANVLVIDPVVGIVKADIGVKEDRIVGIGQAGNPDTQNGVEMVVDAQTQYLPGWGLIATPGGIDCHVHFNAGQVSTYCENGYTTVIGSQFGATFETGVGSSYNYEAFLDAAATIPLNVAMLGRAVSTPAELEQDLDVGVSGFKIHEDFGAFSSVIDATLNVADAADVQVMIHTDTINESTMLSETLDAIDGRTIHAYHVEGTGGGHAPDILEVCSYDNILPSSTNPTNPYTDAALGEHLDMIMSAHLQHRAIYEDLAFAQSRIRPTTMAAEDALHDLGAISMMGTDSNGMGRAAETIRRTWQLASKMKHLAGDDPDGADNDRVLRFLEKYTYCPALSHGVTDDIGSLAPGRLADIVLWDPRFFGVKPMTVVKSGIVSYQVTGPGNGSVLMTEPLRVRPQWGGLAPERLGRIFTSATGLDAAERRRSHYRSRLLKVHGTRHLRKGDFSRNGALPEVRVDPDSFRVTIDGQEAVVPPSTTVPLSRRYLLV